MKSAMHSGSKHLLKILSMVCIMTAGNLVILCHHHFGKWQVLLEIIYFRNVNSLYAGSLFTLMA